MSSIASVSAHAPHAAHGGAPVARPPQPPIAKGGDNDKGAAPPAAHAPAGKSGGVNVLA